MIPASSAGRQVGSSISPPGRNPLAGRKTGLPLDPEKDNPDTRIISPVFIWSLVNDICGREATVH